MLNGDGLWPGPDDYPDNTGAHRGDDLPLPPMEVGSPVAQAIYRIFAGERQVVVTVFVGEQVATGALIAAVIGKRSPWPVRLVADRFRNRMALSTAIEPFLGWVPTHLEEEEKLNPQWLPTVSTGRSAFDRYGIVNVIVDWHESDVVRRSAAAGHRAVFVVPHQLADIQSFTGVAPAKDIPLDIVLAGAPDDQWSPC